MKKRFLNTILPIAAFIALSGTGFGFWVFNNTSTVTSYADFSITDAASLDGLTINLIDNGIILDQTSSDLTIGGNLGCNIDLEHGMAGTVNASNNYEYTTNTTNLSLAFDYQIKVTLGGNLGDYLAVDSVTFITTTSSTAPYIFSATYTSSNTYTSTFKVQLKWINMPTTKDDYETMVFKLSAATLSVEGSISGTPVLSAN